MALGLVFRRYLKGADLVLAQLPGGPRGYQVLSQTAKGPARNQLALAQHLGVDRTVMTYLLDDLVGAGLVERRPDPADRRSRQIVLTDTGRERLCAAERSLQAVEEELLLPLEPRERQVLRGMLFRVAEHAGSVREACQAAHVTMAPDAVR